ncbi:MAG TPA: LysR family transcriptional regulator [Gammaproteobacteria bacterium]|nr:LysR family transcriptional regulator [Gammaproteobacteria bacterium]
MTSLRQLQTLDAVVRGGSFQAGAKILHRSHPSVINLMRSLEEQVGFVLFDRSGYRTQLTEAGEAFYKHALRLLREQAELEALAGFLREGNEARLRIVIGDITPLDETLRVLRGFTQRHPQVQLDLDFENLSGPRERLLDGDADLILHHVDPSDPRFEIQKISEVKIVPVVAPGFLQFIPDSETRYAALRPYTQCIIRDTARRVEKESHFVLEDAHCITVGDQHTKKSIIVQGMAWGHMPDFMVARELEEGALISIEGRYIKGSVVDIVVARIAGEHKGIMARRLWDDFSAMGDAGGSRAGVDH